MFLIDLTLASATDTRGKWLAFFKSLYLFSFLSIEVETEWEFLFNLRGLFLQSVGFPFDSQGPGFSRNFLLLLSHYKAIENGNQTCSLGLVGRMTCLALNIYRCGGKHIPCKTRKSAFRGTYTPGW